MCHYTKLYSGVIGRDVMVSVAKQVKESKKSFKLGVVSMVSVYTIPYCILLINGFN